MPMRLLFKVESARALGLALCLAACNALPSTAEECADLTPASARDECYAVLLPELARFNQTYAEQLAQRIEEAEVRDLVYYRITRDINPGSSSLCSRIQNQDLATRCREITERPHMHQELVRMGLNSATATQQGKQPPPPSNNGRGLPPGPGNGRANGSGGTTEAAQPSGG